jgi:hypothetical protein
MIEFAQRDEKYLWQDGLSSHEEGLCQLELNSCTPHEGTPERGRGQREKEKDPNKRESRAYHLVSPLPYLLNSP